MRRWGNFRLRSRWTDSYPICIHVVSDTLLRYDLLIGTNFLDGIDIRIRGGVIEVCPLAKTACDRRKCDEDGVRCDGNSVR